MSYKRLTSPYYALSCGSMPDPIPFLEWANNFIDKAYVNLLEIWGETEDKTSDSSPMSVLQCDGYQRPLFPCHVITRMFATYFSWKTPVEIGQEWNDLIKEAEIKVSEGRFTEIYQHSWMTFLLNGEEILFDPVPIGGAYPILRVGSMSMGNKLWDAYKEEPSFITVDLQKMAEISNILLLAM